MQIYRRAFVTAAIAALMAAVPLGGRADGALLWQADPGHSSAEFSVKHLVITTVKGRIPIVAATVRTMGDSLVPVQIDATLDPKGLDSSNPDRDSDLRGSGWFDVATYPTITFASNSVVADGKTGFKATGTLNIHGVSKTVNLNGTIDGTITDGRGRKRVAYSAATTIDRREFGLTFLGATPGGDAVVGNDVTISIEVEAVAKPA